MYISAKQLSQELYTAKDIKIGDELSYKSDEIEYTISLDDGRIVKTPGFEIFAFNIDDVKFKRVNNCIYMLVEREEQEYSFLIGTIYEII